MALNERIKGLAKRPFVRSVAMVATGTAIGQALTIAVTPLLTRWFGPSAIGTQGVFNTIVVLLSTVAALGYPAALVLPREDRDAVVLVRLSIYVAAAFGALLVVLMLLCPEEILGVLGATAIADYALLVPIAVFGASLNATLLQWLIRKQAFFLSARASIVTSLGLNATKISLGLVSRSPGALIVGNTAGTFLGTLAAYVGWRRRFPGTPRVADAPSMREMARRHWDFPVLRTPQNLINVISQSLPILLFASIEGATVAGYYSLALTVLAMPGNLIGNAVGSVVYPRVTKLVHDNQNVASFLVRTTGALAAASALPYVVVVVAGPLLFSVVFGANWRVAGEFARLLAPFLFLNLVNKPAVAAIAALQLHAGLLVYEVFSTLSKVLALWIGLHLVKSSQIAVALFSGSGVVAYLILIGWVIKESARRYRAPEAG